jgi:hypothetical protein
MKNVRNFKFHIYPFVYLANRENSLIILTRISYAQKSGRLEESLVIAVLVSPPPLKPIAVLERELKYGVSGKSSNAGSSLELCHAIALMERTSVISR